MNSCTWKKSVLPGGHTETRPSSHIRRRLPAGLRQDSVPRQIFPWSDSHSNITTKANCQEAKLVRCRLCSASQRFQYSRRARQVQLLHIVLTEPGERHRQRQRTQPSTLAACFCEDQEHGQQAKAKQTISKRRQLPVGIHKRRRSLSRDAAGNHAIAMVIGFLRLSIPTTVKFGFRPCATGARLGGKQSSERGKRGEKKEKIEKRFKGAKKSRERGAKRKERGRGKKGGKERVPKQLVRNRRSHFLLRWFQQLWKFSAISGWTVKVGKIISGKSLGIKEKSQEIEKFSCFLDTLPTT